MKQVQLIPQNFAANEWKKAHDLLSEVQSFMLLSRPTEELECVERKLNKLSDGGILDAIETHARRVYWRSWFVCAASGSWTCTVFAGGYIAKNPDVLAPLCAYFCNIANVDVACNASSHITPPDVGGHHEL